MFMKKFMEGLRNIKVQKRMSISFGIVVGLSSIATVLAVILLVFVNYRYSKALENNGFIQGDIGYCSTYLNEERILIRDVVMITDQSVVEAKKKHLPRQMKRLRFIFRKCTIN